MKIVAKVQYIIEPSRLKEYPIGSTKLMIFLLTGSFSSCAIVTG